MYVEVYKGKGKQPWYVRLRAYNGRVVTDSEGYATKANALRAAQNVFPLLEVKVKDEDDA